MRVRKEGDKRSEKYQAVSDKERGERGPGGREYKGKRKGDVTGEKRKANNTPGRPGVHSFNLNA